MQRKEVVAREKEVAAKEKLAHETTMFTIDIEELRKEKNLEEETQERNVGGAELDSPFIVWTRKRQNSNRPRKKQKSNRSIGTTPSILSKGDLDEMGDMVRDITTDLWGHFEEQYQLTLRKVQQDWPELQIQTGRLQMSVDQVSRQ